MRDIVLRDLGIIKAANPLINTSVAARGGFRAGDDTGGGGSPYNPVGVLFSDNFNDQPDWNSGLPVNNFGTNTTGGSNSGGWDVDIAQDTSAHTLPVGWSFARQTPSYAPSKGDADRHEVIEISSASTAENPNRTRGGTGKSFVSWRDSRTDKQFTSDGILGKYFSDGFDQLYVEFWINFSDEMVATYFNPDYQSQTTGLAKLFRIYHWTGEGNTFDFYSDKNPNFLWGFEGRPESQGGYGFRNALTALPRRMSSTEQSQSRFLHPGGYPSNNMPSSYHPNTIAKFGGVNIVDQLTGNDMLESVDMVDIDQVFGDETHWTKMAFFVKMNSAPGAYDGTLIQWVDDRKAIEINTMQWVAATRDMVKWNAVALGGNDNFTKYPNELRHEEWYAIDDVVICDDIPQELL